jgi:hypothetical protein
MPHVLGMLTWPGLWTCVCNNFLTLSHASCLRIKNARVSSLSDGGAGPYAGDVMLAFYKLWRIVKDQPLYLQCIATMG